MSVSGLAQIQNIVSEFADARVMSGAGPRMSQRDSRFRPPPSMQAGYSMDLAIHSQGQMQNMWALANTLIVDHHLVRTAIDTRIAMSRIMDTSPEPQTNDPDLNRDLKALWDDYANDPSKCDVMRKRTFPELSACAAWLHAAHGDVCAPITESSAIKVCEAWRMRSPTRGRDPKYGFLGVVRNPDGQATGYWLTKEQIDPLDHVLVDDVEHYDAFNEKGNSIFLHPMGLGRTAARGISMLTPVGDLLYMQMDAQFCQVVREQLSCCTMFAEETSMEGYAFVKEMLQNDPNALKSLFDDARKTWKAQPGGYHKLWPGKSLKTVNAAVSPANWLALNEFMTMSLAVNLDCPALAITLNAKDANFSQFRNVVHQSKMRFEVFRGWWVPQWNKPVYEHLLRRHAQYDSGLGKRMRAYVRLHGSASLLKCEWSWPEYEYIEPVKDITADSMERALGHITDGQWATRHHAMSWEQFYGQLIGGRMTALKAYFKAKAELLKLPEVVADPLLTKEVYAMGLSEIGPIPMPPKGQPEIMSTYEPPVVEQAPSQGAAA